MAKKDDSSSPHNLPSFSLFFSFYLLYSPSLFLHCTSFFYSFYIYINAPVLTTVQHVQQRQGHTGSYLEGVAVVATQKEGGYPLADAAGAHRAV